MMYGFFPARWALLGGALAVLRWGAFSYWVNSYWGGSVAALAGALALGAYARIRRRPSAAHALLLGAGTCPACVHAAARRPDTGCARCCRAAVAFRQTLANRRVGPCCRACRAGSGSGDAGARRLFQGDHRKSAGRAIPHQSADVRLASHARVGTSKAGRLSKQRNAVLLPVRAVPAIPENVAIPGDWVFCVYRRNTLALLSRAGAHAPFSAGGRVVEGCPNPPPAGMPCRLLGGRIHHRGLPSLRSACNRVPSRRYRPGDTPSAHS